jgi:hypothetical protein
VARGKHNTLHRLKAVGRLLFGSGRRIIATIFVGSITAVAGGWLSGALGFGASQPGDPPHPTLLRGWIVREGGVHVYARPARAGQLRTTFELGEAVSFVGFCIGEPVPSATHWGTDERWLILAKGGLIPAADIEPTGLTASSRLQSCPHAESGRAGPQYLRLTAQRLAGATLLHVIVKHPTIVGFAVLEARTMRWRALPLRFASRPALTVRDGESGPASALAVACWAQDVPAYRDEPSNFVAGFAKLGGASRGLYDISIEHSPSGAAKACAGASPPEHHTPAPRKHTGTQMPHESPAPTPTQPSQTSASTSTPSPPPQGTAHTTESHGKDAAAGEEVIQYWQEQ